MMRKGQIISKKDLKGIYLERIQASKNISMISLFNFKSMQVEEWNYYLTIEINWWNISCCQNLSEPFIERFQDKVDWIYISWRSKLSESFIEKFQNKVHWENISLNQSLSESFIEEYQDKVDWVIISHFQKLSKSFRHKWKHKLG